MGAETAARDGSLPGVAMLKNGYQLVARSLGAEQVEALFYLIGGPMHGVMSECIAAGIRPVYVRHEQAAAMMAHAYSRVAGRVGVCMACSGPGTLNLATGIANAWVDCAPVVALGGSAPLFQTWTDAFQEMDQVAAFRPFSKWAAQVQDPRRIPEMIHTAFRIARTGKPGPVYLDLPADVLYARIDDGAVFPATPSRELAGPLGDPVLVERAIDLLGGAERPLVLSGSGILWSGASRELQEFVELTGIPFYTTPQGRGVIPDDHALSFPGARAEAFREADAILMIGTRLNFVFNFGRSPRFRPDVKVIQVNIDPADIGKTRRVEVGIVGDAKAVLGQLTALARSRFRGEVRYSAWIGFLGEKEAARHEKLAPLLNSEQVPIHPLRLCRDLRLLLPREAIVIVDGHEILNYGRQSIPTFVPGHRLNSGPFGTMGVGVPFGVGAKVAKPEASVVVLSGDGAFGLNMMEIDTAIRHHLPFVTVISNNGGWTADPEGTKPGRDLGFSRYDKLVEDLGGHGEFVEKPNEILPALERAFAAGRVACVNVLTDPRARAETVRFSTYTT